MRISPKSVMYLVLCLSLVASNLSFSQQLFKELESRGNPTFYEIQKAADDQWGPQPPNQRRGWKQYKRWEWFWESRVSPSGIFPDYSQIYRDAKVFLQDKGKDKALSARTWRQLGPFGEPEKVNMGVQGIGRVNIVRVNPANPNELWAGSAGGGVWKSMDAGKSWITFPFTQFMSLGVSDIAISPKNPSIVYVTTGDADGAGAVSVSVNSVGVIKTTDGGKNWSKTNLDLQLSSGKILARCLVHPDNPNIVLVSSSDGIYKTTDGGNSWVVKQGGSFIDMEFKPDDPNIIYAGTRKWSNNEIYRSTDMGETWNVVLNFANARRIALAVTIANPDKVYALVASVYRSFHSFVVSDDAGENWDVTAQAGSSPNVLGRDNGADGAGQGEYDLAIAVAPYDEDLVFVGGINMWKSEDGGYNWKQVSHWVGGYGFPFVHADIHDLVFDDYNGILYSAHDGGVDKSINDGVSWDEASDNFSIMQFYRMSNSASQPNLIIAGAQDNGTNRYINGKWQNVYGGDGMECIINPVDPDKVYVSLYNGELRRSVDGGNNFVTMLNQDMTGEPGSWVTPYIIDPQEPSVLYAGYFNVFKLTENGAKYQKISNFKDNQQLQSMAIAPGDRNYIYAASYTKLYATYDGGLNWKQIPGMPSGISYIAVDYTNPKRIWVTASSYNSTNKIVEYDGTKITDLTGNLPNIAVNTVAVQKDSPDRLYIGTDIGVFMSENGTGSWQPYGEGMPNLVVTELEIQYASRMLRAATYGGGVWETKVSECNLAAPTIEAQGPTTVCPGDSVILTASSDYDNYLWSNGQKTKSITVREEGKYSLTIEDKNGCKAVSKSLEVNFHNAPRIVIKALDGMPACEGAPMKITLSASAMLFDAWKWSTGDTTSKITVDKEGDYSVLGRTKDGCWIQSEVFNIKAEKNPPIPVITWADHKTLSAPYAVKYQWYLNGEPIQGATEQTYVITDVGMVSVRVYNEAGCSSISDELQIISSVRDITNDMNLNIHPNPGKGLFTAEITVANPGKIDVSVRNILGIEVYTASLIATGNKVSTEVNLNSLPSGVYYITVKTSEGTLVNKLIKE